MSELALDYFGTIAAVKGAPASDLWREQRLSSLRAHYLRAPEIQNGEGNRACIRVGA
jgi:hypothetical protein